MSIKQKNDTHSRHTDKVINLTYALEVKSLWDSTVECENSITQSNENKNYFIANCLLFLVVNLIIKWLLYYRHYFFFVLTNLN